MRFKTLRLIVFSLFLFSACIEKAEKKKSSNDQVILETIDQAINKITYNSLDSQILVHAESYPDKFRNLSIQKVIPRDTNFLQKAEMDLVNGLSKRTLDSTRFKFKQPYHFKYNLIVEPDYAIQESEDRVEFGKVILMDPEVQSDTLACYYISLDCHLIAYDCSVGYLVFVNRSNHQAKWNLKKIHQVWQAGRPIVRD